LRGELLQALERLGIQPVDRLHLRVFIQIDAAVELAARDARADQLAQDGLQSAQLLGDAKLEIEESGVHGAQLDRERSARAVGRKRRRYRSVARHAVDHSLS